MPCETNPLLPGSGSRPVPACATITLLVGMVLGSFSEIPAEEKSLVLRVLVERLVLAGEIPGYVSAWPDGRS